MLFHDLTVILRSPSTSSYEDRHFTFFLAEVLLFLQYFFTMWLFGEATEQEITEINGKTCLDIRIHVVLLVFFYWIDLKKTIGNTPITVVFRLLYPLIPG